MISSNNQENSNSQAKIQDGYRRDWYFTCDDSREDGMMEERVDGETKIFREGADVDHTPIEQSNDSPCTIITLSPAWSQDSMEHMDPVKPTGQTEVFIYWDETPSSSVTKISDFVRDSERIQKLNFSSSD
eukprot:scaffold2315_cov113-Cylindrotheca_fusiformis.AAC.19